MRIIWAFTLGALLAISGCGTPHPRAPEEVVRQAKERKDPKFFDDLEMTQAQRKEVLAIVDQLYEDFAKYDRVRLVLLDRTVEQVRAGQLNREELMPLAENAIHAFEDALPHGIEAMQRLHGTLTKAQREKLVALFTEERKMTPEERRAARNAKITRVLDLTAGQKTKIYPALLALYIRHWGVIGRFREALEEAQDAFVQDHLVAKDLAIATELELLALGEVIFEALEIGMSNLTREQQQTLAALLDSQLRSPNPTKSAENERLEERDPSRSSSSAKSQ